MSAIEKAFGLALVAALEDPETRERVAELLAPYLVPTAPAQDRWLSTKEAAEYLGVTPNAMHKLTGKREIPFEQDGPGAKCWFQIADLDAYRRGVGTHGLREAA
jgi:excisionase family DNA binding protein